MSKKASLFSILFITNILFTSGRFQKTTLSWIARYWFHYNFILKTFRTRLQYFSFSLASFVSSSVETYSWHLNGSSGWLVQRSVSMPKFEVHWWTPRTAASISVWKEESRPHWYMANYVPTAQIIRPFYCFVRLASIFCWSSLNEVVGMLIDLPPKLVYPPLLFFSSVVGYNPFRAP